MERERNRVAKLHKREKEMKVLSENEMQMMNKHFMRQKEKKDDVSAYHDFKSLVETREHKMIQEKTDRQDRIKKLLNRMPQITVEQTVTQDKEIDHKIRQIQERREYEEKVKDDKKREDMRRMQDEMKWLLDVQVQEKKARERQERMANEEYFKQVVQKV